jgi:hypothetical protein
MARIDIDSLLVTLGLELTDLFPTEEFLEVELSAVIQALFTSLRWAALRKAKETANGNALVDEIKDLTTEDHFASAWLDRRELLDRISHTSGLNEEQANHSLRIIESLVDTKFSEWDRSVQIEGICTISAPEFPRYSIELGQELAVGPDELSSKAGSA